LAQLKHKQLGRVVGARRCCHIFVLSNIRFV